MKMIKYNNRPLPTNFLRFFDDNFTKLEQQNHRPAVNIAETDEAFALEMLAPGRVKEHFNVGFNEGTLEITYTTPTTEVKEGEETTPAPNFRRREFRLVDFTRRFQLDESVIDVEAIEATYEHGILRLALPKLAEAQPKPARQIAVA